MLARDQDAWLIPVAQKHRDVLGMLVGHGQVLCPVAIEIPYFGSPAK